MPARTRSAPASTVTTPPPAYFLSLTVENVRCFGPAQTLKLSDGNGAPARWTVILGDNGSGKSTLLQCLVAVEPYPDTLIGTSLLKSAPGISSENTIPRILTKFAHVDSYSKWPLPRDVTTWTRILADIAYGKALNEEKTSKKRQLHVIWRGNRNADSDIAEDYIPHLQYNISYHRFHEIGGLRCYAYGSSRRISSVPIAFGDNDDPAATLFSEDIPLRNPEAWWLQIDYNARLNTEDNKRFARYAAHVKDALINLLPDVVDLKIVPPRDVRGRPSVEAQTPFGWVPLRRLSSGYQSQIAWVVDLASRLVERYPDSDNPLAEPAIVLVDEIDLHMHPSWQRKVIGYLTERLPNTQFIVTAHSPLIVQAAEGANLVLLRREGDHVVIDNDPVRLRNWRVDQILTSDLFGLESARPPQIEGLLKERRALLSKGRLTTRDRRRIEALEAKIGDLPVGDTVEDNRAMEIIRRAAAKLQSEDDG